MIEEVACGPGGRYGKTIVVCATKDDVDGPISLGVKIDAGAQEKICAWLCIEDAERLRDALVRACAWLNAPAAFRAEVEVRG